jgi:hypothetical protein
VEEIILTKPQDFLFPEGRDDQPARGEWCAANEGDALKIRSTVTQGFNAEPLQLCCDVSGCKIATTASRCPAFKCVSTEDDRMATDVVRRDRVGQGRPYLGSID